MKNKCTLLVDGNWLLMSRWSVMMNLFDKNNSDAQLQSATDNLTDMMARSINVMLNRIPSIDNIIFISDGGSWRKQLPIPKQLEGTTYKGNRESKVEISWNHVYKALNNLSNSCEKQGITTCTQLNIEGDDWVWYWSRRLNAEGINCIIWSSDNDLKQLIQNKDGVFTAWYYERSGKNELAFHDSFENKEPDPTDLDFFMQPLAYRPVLLESLTKLVNKTNYVDPNTIITGKVICGDSGDNIKSVVRVKKNGRTYGVGPKDWKKISTKLNIFTIQDLIGNINKVAKEISLMKKFAGQVKPSEVMEMIEYNVKLVWLNEKVIPDTVVDIMNQHDYKQFDVNYIRGSYRVLLDESNDISEVFDNIQAPF